MASTTDPTSTKRAAAATTNDEPVDDSSSSNHKKLRGLFEGDEAAPLESCLGSWVVVHDLILDGTEDAGCGSGPEIEEWNRSKGCLVEFSETHATIQRDTVDGNDDHLEGILTPKETIKTPSGRKLLTYEWNPPKDKVDGKIGYSDVWDFVKSGDFSPVVVSVEGNINNSGCTEKFPLHDDLFVNGDDDGQASKARDQLPEAGIIMLVHWYGMSFEEFGIKEFLYLCRPDDVKKAEDVLNEHGAYKTINCGW